MKENSEITTAFKSVIDNLDFTEFNNTNKFETINIEVAKEFEMFTKILKDTSEYIYKKFHTLDTIIIGSNDFNTYSQEDKIFVSNFVKLYNTILEIYEHKLTFDGVNISRQTKRAFGKIQTLIS